MSEPSCASHLAPLHEQQITLQLEQDMRESMQQNLSQRRPLLTHLNADTSWLLQLPRPAKAIARPGARQWYNVLIDPWLSGSQSDVASWFSQQWHAEKPAIDSIAKVDALCRELDSLGPNSQPHERVHDSSDTLIDVVTISHEFTDHCHKDTLLQIHPNVPVFAANKAAELIRSWGHFRVVYDAPAFDASSGDWRAMSTYPLPDWLSISRVIDPQNRLYYHSALLIAFALQSDQEAAEAVVYTPHGIDPAPLVHLAKADPPISTLALLHGLHDIALGSAQQLNLGAHNGLQVQRALKAKYWIGTHDEVKTGYGLVSWFLRRKVISVVEALERERKTPAKHDDGSIDEPPNYANLGNGNSMILA